MCVCTPSIRTPFCGKPGCEMPEQKTQERRAFQTMIESNGVALMLTRSLGGETFTLNGWPLNVRAPRIEIVGDSVHVSFYLPLSPIERKP